MHLETPIRRSLLQTGSPRAATNSNRYTLRIEFPVSYRKQRTGAHSNRYKRPGSFAHFPKINRKPNLIERPVNHRKQRAGIQINRKLSRGSTAPSSAITSHSPLACPACPDAGRERMRKVTRHNFSNPRAPLASPTPKTPNPTPCPTNRHTFKASRACGKAFTTHQSLQNQSRHLVIRNTPKPFKINDRVEINRDISRPSRPAFSACPPDYFNRPRVPACGPSDVASAFEAVLHRGGRRRWWQYFLSRGLVCASRQLWCSRRDSKE
jgi:hypothetical protein